MKIRLVKDTDYVEMASLQRATIRNVNSKDYPKDAIEVWLKRTNAEKYKKNEDEVKRWVAVENDKVIGFCGHSFKCEISGLYVHKDYIGKGVGYKLLQKAEESLKKDGCKEISIMSTITAKDFYQRQGYKITKKGYHSIEGINSTVYFMEKKMVFGRHMQF